MSDDDETEWLLDGRRVRLRAPGGGDVERLVAFQTENRKRFASLQGQPSEEFYTSAWWSRRIALLGEEARSGRLLYLLVFAKAAPKRVTGMISFPNISYAPFYGSDIGFAVDEKHEGTGLMRESLELAIEYVFQRRELHRLTAEYAVTNVRSAGLLQRLGFQREGLRRAHMRVADGWEDFVITGLVNERWNETASPS